MVGIMCHTPDTVRLQELTPFQGDLKRRTSKDVAALADSIRAEGLLMPFAVWQHDGVNSLLDGHGRLAALTEIALVDQEAALQDYPVIFIHAESEEQARKALLQITSAYGRVTREGVKSFCAVIPEYRAPAINKFVARPKKERALRQNDVDKVIRIAVKADRVQAVLDLFKTVDYIRVL